MATGYNRPSLATIGERIIGDISSRSRGSAYIRVSFERILARVLQGAAHGLHGHLEWLYKQLSPVTCDIDMLLAWGVLLQLPRNPATKATRWATFTGTNTTELPIDRALQSADGAGWTVITGGVVSGGTVTVEIEANDAGSDGNLDEGAPMSIVSTLSGIDSAGVIAATEGVDGSDLEEVEDYRIRILENLRTPPSGGGPGDYVGWAKQVSGVTRAWEFGNRMGVGTVSVAFVRDDDADEEDYDAADIIPNSPEVAAVQAYIDGVHPLDMRAAYVVAPVNVPVNMTIALSPNTTPVQDAVRAELIELFKTEANLETTIAESVIDEAISTAEGELAHEITSISSLDPGDWGLLTLGTINFTSL